NVSPTSAPLGLTIDTAAPAAPSAQLAPASDTGIPGDGVTADATPTFSGTAEPGSVVTLYVDGAAAGTAAAGPGGAWAVTPAGLLADGSFVVTATATDAAGNVSAASETLTVTVDTAAPAAQVTPGSDTGASGTDGVTAGATPT